jgi:hypothetical protein
MLTLGEVRQNHDSALTFLDVSGCLRAILDDRKLVAELIG